MIDGIQYYYIWLYVLVLMILLFIHFVLLSVMQLSYESNSEKLITTNFDLTLQFNIGNVVMYFGFRETKEHKMVQKCH